MPAMKIESASSRRKSILIVDDHPIVRLGLTALIDSATDLVVCGEASTCTAALRAIAEHAPDLVIVDIALEGSDGLDLLKQMSARYPAIPALVLSMHEEEVYAERCLRAGAKGYLDKQQLDDTVLVAIRRLLGGGMYVSEKVGAQLCSRYLSGHTLATSGTLQTLTDRQLQVFRLIGQGQSTRRIAEALHLSIKTVESHCEHIKQKLQLGSAMELTRRATLWVAMERSGSDRGEISRIR